MSDEQVNRRQSEYLDPNMPAQGMAEGMRQPTEEELYWKRMAQSNAQLGYTNQGIGGWQTEGPKLDYNAQTAYEREQNALRKRVYDVEDEQRKLLTKVENLQESLTASCKHVAELNDKLDSLNAWDDEQERQDRWHETYNSSHATAYRGTTDTDEEYRARVESNHQAAVDAADRAHGPLEPSNQSGASKPLRPGAFNQMDVLRGVTLDGPEVDEGPFFKHITFVENPEMYTMYKRSDVDALAKAASDAWVYIGSQPETIGGRLVFKVLDAALKPFKRSE